MSEPVRILIIDDEEAFTFFVKLNLETDGRFAVITANRGEDGLKMAQSMQPDLILLDIMMPGMFGTEVAQKLAADGTTKDIPVIFLTAVLKKETAEQQGFMPGDRELMVKPVTRDELVSRIEKVLRLKQK